MKDFIKLDSLIGRAAERALSEAQLQASPALVAEGWERRFTADEPRAKEATEIYSQLGYEVRWEPVRPEDIHDECDDCKALVAYHFQTVYTRKR